MQKQQPVQQPPKPQQRPAPAPSKPVSNEVDRLMAMFHSL